MALKQQQDELREMLQHQEAEQEAAAATAAARDSNSSDVRDVALLRRSSDGSGAQHDPLLAGTSRHRRSKRDDANAAGGGGTGGAAAGVRAGRAGSNRSSGSGSSSSAANAGPFAPAGQQPVKPSYGSLTNQQQPLPPAPRPVSVSALSKAPLSALSPSASAAALANTGGSSHFTFDAVGGVPPAGAAARVSITAMWEATAYAPPSSKSSDSDSFMDEAAATPIMSPMVAVSPLAPGKRSYLESPPPLAAGGRSDGRFGAGGGEMQTHEGGGGGGADGDGIDDNASDVSGVSGMSEVIDSASHIADYRRGKRYKKLLKVLESPAVQRAARDFTWQALLANVAQLLANALAFVLMTVLMAQQAANVQNLHSASALNRRMHEAFVVMQVRRRHVRVRVGVCVCDGARMEEEEVCVGYWRGICRHALRRLPMHAWSAGWMPCAVPADTVCLCLSVQP